MRGTRLAIRDQIPRGKKSATESNEVIGVILNVSSLVAQLSHFNQPLYCASKAGVSNFTRLLAMLQPEFGIKVVAVAPGIVDTPLWRADPDKMKMLGGDDVLITVDELAAKMLLVVESEKYPGGTVLEVLKESTRIVHADSPLPTGPGSTVSHMESVTKDTINLLREEQRAGAKSK
jgi:NAD(P)-dependent dehydrogenase (short-subunit alcohol dehydrogenase family)